MVLARQPDRKALGRKAESRVARAALGRGWRLLARNFTVRGGELDLVYGSASELIVVEVRYRGREDYGGALASVTRTKQRRIIHATRYFLARHPKYADMAIRFDVVGIDGHGQMHWIENAFYAE